jgi:hypothetical protein
LKPSSDAINVGNGFACIIKHSYDLASLFGLLEAMPLPGLVYQTAAFIPYYQVATLIKKLHLTWDRYKEMAETFYAYEYITEQLDSFKKLKELIKGAYQPSDHGLIHPVNFLRLAVAFMEAVADIDEANRNGLLFVQDVPKGKSML